MSTELEVLKQRITELEAKNVKLEAENAELRKENTEISYLRNKLSVSDAEIAELKRSNTEFLRANKEYNERRDAENAKLRAENVEFRDRLTIVEQRQVLNEPRGASHNSSNIRSSNFNSVADQLPNNNADIKSSEDKKMDSFMDGSEKNQPKGALHMTEISLTGREENNCQEKIESQGCLAELACSDVLQNINRLYENACTAENERVKANQAEILCWRNFIIGLDNSIGEIMIKEKVGTKKAKGLIYNFILAHNHDTKRKTLYQRISRARKVYEFTEKIGIDKIKYIKTYGANSIAELSDSQIQTIVDYFSKNPNTELPDDQDVSYIDSEEEISDDQTNASEAVSAGVSNPLEADGDFYKMLLGSFEEDGAYVDKEVDSTPQLVKETNEEMPDDSDDDGYGGYNEYGECDRGYYYRDGGYERKTSPMMSPIISPVTAC